MRTTPGLLLVASVGLIAPVLQGSTIFYTSQSSFLAAAAADGLATNTIDFESVPTGSYDTSSGLTVDGLNFVGPNSGSYQLQVGPAFFPTGTGNTLTAVGEIDVTLPPDTYAFAADVGSSFVYYSDADSSIEFQLSTGDSDSVPITPTSLFPFFGFISDTPVASLQILGPSFLSIDNVTSGTASSVPEPSTLLPLLCAAPVLLLVTKKRRR